MNIEELFDNELWSGYGLLTTEDANCLINYLKTEVMEYVDGLRQRIAELEAQVPKVVKPHIEIVDCGTDTVDLDFCDCGSEVAGHEDYCPDCGAKLDWSSND